MDDVTHLRAEVCDLRREMTQAILIDLEERLAAQHTDLSSKVACAMGEAMATGRRLALLEQQEFEQTPQAASTEPFRRLGLPVPSSMPLLQTVPRMQPDATSTTTFVGTLPSSQGKALGSSQKPVAPVVVGRRVEWHLTPEQLSGACAGATALGPLVSRELEVSGAKFRLKFYPAGSPLHMRDGFCSLYLLALVPVEVHFRLFAGGHTTPVLEARNRSTAGKDIGRHDLCLLDSILGAEGGALVGAELLNVLPLQEEDSVRAPSQPPFRP